MTTKYNKLKHKENKVYTKENEKIATTQTEGTKQRNQVLSRRKRK